MKKTFYSNGKLLITSEYVVLDGAKALALPTKFGQNLIVEKGKNKEIVWKSFDKDNSIWFNETLLFSEIIEKIAFENKPEKNTLIAILHEAFLLNPIYINCHSGKDYFAFEQNKELVDFTIKRSSESNVPIYHETHRGRMLFAAHISKNFIEKIEGLRLTLDISHWCNVHESLLADQKDTIDLALSRTNHIHARIGHAEGPQVNDPRAPEWADAVKAHFSWWDQVVKRRRAEGKFVTFLTEFGPPNYLQTLPYTNQPVANQWDINVYMMQLLRKRYS